MYFENWVKNVTQNKQWIIVCIAKEKHTGQLYLMTSSRLLPKREEKKFWIVGISIAILYMTVYIFYKTIQNPSCPTIVQQTGNRTVILIWDLKNQTYLYLFYKKITQLLN